MGWDGGFGWGLDGGRGRARVVVVACYSEFVSRALQVQICPEISVYDG